MHKNTDTDTDTTCAHNERVNDAPEVDRRGRHGHGEPAAPPQPQTDPHSPQKTALRCVCRLLEADPADSGEMFPFCPLNASKICAKPLKHGTQTARGKTSSN